MSSKNTEGSAFSEVFSWIVTIVVAVAIALLIRTFVFQVVQVQQTSMYPTLEDNDKLIASKISYSLGDPKRGDIAVIKIDENTDYVKRVIGLPGDVIKIENNKVYLNGEIYEEFYISDELEYSDYPETHIPPGHYFMIGDNRPRSKDSRDSSLGPIKRENVTAKIVFRITPFSKFGSVK